MRPSLKSCGIPLLCGILLALSFPTWRLYPFAWIALAPLFYQTARTKPLEGAKRFFVAGWAFHTVLFQWLITNIYWAGGWAVWGYQFLCLFMALYWALFGLLWTWMHRRMPGLPGALAAAVLWAAMEYLQATLLTGFGWSSLAYSQGKDLMLLQWAALGGATLVSAILVFFNALVGLLFAERSWRLVRLVGALGVLVVAHGVGALLIQDADYGAMPLKAGIVQSDFPLEMKWDPEYCEEMVRNAAQKSRALAKYEQVDLFVWPEALVVKPLDTTPALFEIVASLTCETGCPLFTGSDRLNEKSGNHLNSSFLVDGNGALVGYYDKVHLAPFGEYVPLADLLPFVDKVVPAIGDIEPGEELKVLPVGERRFGPLICFEVLFAPLAEELRGRGADFLVVITNLAWFGGSNGIPQELEVARVRAIETRLPLVHCANTGISGVFDPWGRFSVVNAVIDRAGRYVQFPDLEPRDFVMQRCVGALPVAAPGRRPVPGGPRLFPWVVLVASLAGVIAALFFAKPPDTAGRPLARK